MAEKAGIINRSGTSISALNIPGATETRIGLTITADRISTPGVITKNIMIVIGRSTEQNDTFLGTGINITDRFIDKIITAIR
jgi:hypothetical protein